MTASINYNKYINSTGTHYIANIAVASKNCRKNVEKCIYRAAIGVL